MASCNHLARVRADARRLSGTSECRCDSGHLFTFSGCSSVGERVVGDDEAAGAIPAAQTTMPLFRGSGRKFAKLVGRGSTPLSGTTCVEVWVTELDSKSG